MSGWEDQFKHLTAACGGKLNPDTLEVFQRAMAEYEVFMDGMRRMFAPRDQPCNEQDEALRKGS
jgi:hypothetical protein